MRINNTIGYELYARCSDRIESQCNQIINISKILSSCVRESDNKKRRKKILKNLTSWFNVLKLEVEGLNHNVNDKFDGYKE